MNRSTAPHQLPGAALLALRETATALRSRMQRVEQQIIEQQEDLERTRRTMIRLNDRYTEIIGVIGEQPSLAEDLARGDELSRAEAESADFLAASRRSSGEVQS